MEEALEQSSANCHIDQRENTIWIGFFSEVSKKAFEMILRKGFSVFSECFVNNRR